MSTQVAYMTFLEKESYNFSFNSNLGVTITDMPEWLWNDLNGTWYLTTMYLII